MYTCTNQKILKVRPKTYGTLLRQYKVEIKWQVLTPHTKDKINTKKKYTSTNGRTTSCKRKSNFFPSCSISYYMSCVLVSLHLSHGQQQLNELCSFCTPQPPHSFCFRFDRRAILNLSLPKPKTFYSTHYQPPPLPSTQFPSLTHSWFVSVLIWSRFVQGCFVLSCLIFFCSVRYSFDSLSFVLFYPVALFVLLCLFCSVLLMCLVLG